MRFSRREFVKSIIALPLLGPRLGIWDRLLIPPGKGGSSSIRSSKWVQTAADFAVGEKSGLAIFAEKGGGLRLAGGTSSGVYLSPPFRTDFPFNSVALQWEADIPQGSDLNLSFRSSENGLIWSEWMAVSEMADFKTEVTGHYGNLVGIPGTYVQWRAAFQGSSAASPLLREVGVVYIDSSSGPTSATAQTLSLAAAEPANVVAPLIISRAGWGCPEPYGSPGWPPQYRRVEKIVVHHTDTSNEYVDGARVVRDIWEYHTKYGPMPYPYPPGWGDVGYNYLIDRYGYIYEGRYGGDDVIGGHVGSYNPGTCGIAIIGSFEGPEVPLAARDAVVRLMAWVAYRRDIHPLRDSFFVDRSVSNVCGHLDLNATLCPGSDLYNRLYFYVDNVESLRVRTFRAFPKYLDAWLGHNTPTRMLVGETKQVNVSVVNRGWLTWVAREQYPVRLGYHWYRDGSQYVQDPADDRRTYLPWNVEFNQRVDIAGLVTAPRVPGTYTLKWDLVHELVDWFNNKGAPTLDVSVNVIGPQLSVSSPSLVFLADSTSNPSSQTITIQNTGGGTLRWSASSNQSWCVLDEPSGNTPDTLIVRIDKNIANVPETYTATVTISSVDASNSPQSVNVTFRYSASPLKRLYMPQINKGGSQ